MKKIIVVSFILFMVLLAGCGTETQTVTIDQYDDTALSSLYNEEDFQNEKLEDYYLQCFFTYDDNNSPSSYLHFALDYPFLVNFTEDFNFNKSLQHMAVIQDSILNRYGDSIELPDKDKCYGYNDFNNINADFAVPNYWDSFYFKYCDDNQFLLSFPEPVEYIYNTYISTYGQDISTYKYYLLENNAIELWEPAFPIKKEHGYPYINKITWYEPDSYGLFTIGFGEITTDPQINFVLSDKIMNPAKESVYSINKAVMPSFSADGGIVAWLKSSPGMNNSDNVGIITVWDSKNDEKYEISYSDWCNLYILGVRNNYLYILNNLQPKENGAEVADLNIINLNDMSRSVISNVFENTMQPVTISPDGRYVGYNKIDGNSAYGNELRIYDLYKQEIIYSAMLPIGNIAPVWLSKPMIDSFSK